MNKDNSISNEKLLDIIHKLIREGITETDEQTEIINKEYGIEVPPHIVTEIKYRDKTKRWGL